MKNKKVLVAGAAGFLGSHLVDSLIASGLKVVGVDDLLIGKEENISHLYGSNQFDFIEANINQRLPDALFAEEWLTIVHAANAESFVRGKRLELNELLQNSFGVKNLLDLSLRTKSRFVLTSTINLYAGLASHTNVTNYYEDAPYPGILSYAEAKRYAEALTQEYASIYGVDVRVARLSDTYGPRMDLEADALLPQLIEAGLQGRVVALEDVGSRMVYMTYFSDVIYGLNKLVVRDDSNLKGGIFYLVNDEPVSVLSVALTVKEYAPQDMSVEFLPRVEESLFKLPVVDLSRSRNELYWTSKISLQEGIKRTMEYFHGKPLAYPKETKKVTIVSEPKPETPELSKKKEVPSTETLEEQPAAPVVQEDTTLISDIPTESESQKQVEQAVFENLVDETEERLQQPELPRPTPAASLDKPRGWLALKNKKPSLPLRGVTSKVQAPHWFRQVVLGIVVFLAIWFFFLPVIGLGVHSVGGYLSYRKLMTASQESDFPKAQERLVELQNRVRDSQYYWHRLVWIGNISGQSAKFENITRLLLGTESVLEAGYWGIQFAREIEPWWGPLTSGGDSEEYRARRTPQQLDTARVAWRFYRQHVTVGGKIFEEVHAQPLAGLLAQRITPYTRLVVRVAEATNIADADWQYLNDWFGFTTPQELIVLFQNNHELRPGGGFIGSYARLQVENGTITSFLVDDIYNPDGQLELKVPVTQNPAPAPIREYLMVDYLGLRDTNWYPHFPEAGENFIDLFEQATDVRPQWVIGINLLMVEDLLEVVGPLHLPIANDSVTADTLFEKAEVASEVGFEPGSTGKKDFLTEVAQQLWLQLFPLSRDRFFQVVAVAGKHILQEDILLYSDEQTWQSIMEQAHVAGQLTETDQDYLYVVSSNVGGNKSNHWIERSTDYFVAIDRQGRMVGTTRISFTHTATSETWPSGLYRDYLRVYVPEGAELLSSEGFATDVITGKEYAKTVLNGLVEVPVGSTKEVKLEYSLPAHIQLRDGGAYQIIVQRQPGIDQEPLSVQIGIPFFLDIQGATVGHERLDNTIRWETQLDMERKFTVQTTPN